MLPVLTKKTLLLLALEHLVGKGRGSKAAETEIPELITNERQLG